jgi:hypothetical protein
MTREKAVQIATAFLGPRDPDDPRSSQSFDAMVQLLMEDAEYAASMEAALTAQQS